MFDIPMNTKPPVSLAEMVGGSSLTPLPSQSVVQQTCVPVNPQPAPTVQPVPQSATRPSYGGIHLKKGQKTALVLANGGALDVIKAGLSWEVSGQQYDLDVECFMLGANGKVLGDDWFVFYYNLKSPDGAITHSGDCKDGSLPGDDEVITIQLSALDPRVKKLVFIVTIDKAKQLGLNFAGVKNAAIHIQDCASGTDLCSFQLTDYYANVTSMVVGEIYNHNGQWKFNPVGDGITADLYELCARYGVNVVD